jgi:hypothetical protein
MISILVAPILVTGCSFFAAEDVDASYPISNPDERRRDRQNHGKITGDGLIIFGGDKEKQGGAGAGIGINSYLWRATLDTLSFMPLAQADPFGGVIITDWYQNPEAKDEQFKINVLILDQALRTNALKVSVFKRVRSKNEWVDEPASEQVARDLENKILTRARELRIADGK